MNGTPIRRNALLLAIVVAAVVFGFDLFVELAVAAAVPYVVVVWLAYAAGNPRGVWAAATVCTLLTAAGLFFSPPGGELWKALANRGLAILAIWVTSTLCLRVLYLLGTQTLRAEVAEQSAADSAQRREEEQFRSQAMASVMDDLKIERQKLAASEHRLRLTIETSLDSVVTIDQDGVIVDWNPQAERTFGWTNAQAVGQTLGELIVPPQYREAHRKGLEHFRATGEGPALNQRLELSALRRSGEEFPIELAIAPLRMPQGYQFSAFVRDISRRKRSESQLRTYATKLEQSNTELEQFAYVVSHDLKAPLRGIGMAAKWLAEDLAGVASDATKENIQLMLDRIDRINKLIDGILRYSRVGRNDVSRVVVDVDSLVEDIVASVAIPPNIKMRIKHPLPQVVYDETQLRQVFQNLIDNAVKHLGKPAGEVTVFSDCDGSMVRFHVADTGVGIPDRQFDRIFRLFQTLKPKDECDSSGAGLAISKRIVETNGGSIQVFSELDRGTEFVFTVPLETAPLAEKLQASIPP